MLPLGQNCSWWPASSATEGIPAANRFTAHDPRLDTIGGATQTALVAGATRRTAPAQFLSGRLNHSASAFPSETLLEIGRQLIDAGRSDGLVGKVRSTVRIALD
jgi:hypothetical protein